MGDKAQRRVLTLTVLATFVALQIPLKKLVAEMVPGKRGPREDGAEALVQGAARTAAVILASTLVRGLADRESSGAKSATRKNSSIKEGSLEVTVEL